MASTPEFLYWDVSVPEWKILKSMVLPSVVDAVDLVTGGAYTIVKVANTNWTSIGAASSNVGVSFTKNSTTPIGTGTAHGPGTYTGGNPVLRVNIIDELGAARQAQITVANTALKPNTDGTSTNPTLNPQIGMFSDFFKPFTFIRIRDSATMHILFSGEVYKVSNSFDEGQYGATILIEARDALADLQKNSMSYLGGDDRPDNEGETTNSGALTGKGLDLIYSTGTSGTHYWRRSEIIKFLIREAIWKGGDDTAQSITYSSTALFHDSEENFTLNEAKKNYTFKNKNLTALQHIASLAKQDWFEDAEGTIVHGYDYYAHPFITSMLKTVAPPPMMLAYHKRLTEPTIDPENYGASIRYQARNKLGTVDEQTFLMLDGYEFNDTSNETYTHVAAEYYEYLPRSGGIDEEEDLGYTTDLTLGHGTLLKVHNSLFTIIYGDIPASGTGSGTASGKFRVTSNASEQLNMKQTSPLYTDAAGAAANGGKGDEDKVIGWVQYQSGTGDDNYIIISHADSKKMRDITSGSLYEATGNYGNGVVITLSGQKIIANTLGRIRIKRMDLKEHTDNVDLVRDAIASTLVNTTGGDPVQRGYFRIADFPHVKWSGTANSSSSGTTLYTDQNTGLSGAASGVGFEQGHTVTHKAGTVLYAGQIGSVPGNDRVTVPMYRVDTLESGSPSTRNWAAGNEYTVYVPLRAGQTVFVDNRLIPIYGIHLIVKTMYTWQNGYVSTDFETLGRNEARGTLQPEYGDLGNTSPPTDIETVPVNPKGVTLENLEWIYTDYNTLGWRPVGGTGSSTLRIKEGGSFTIAASNTDTILTAASMTSPMQADKTYVLYFDYKRAKTQFKIAITEPVASATYVPESHFIEMGFLTIGENKDGGRVNFIKNFGVDSDFSPFNIAAPKILTPNSLAATLLGKTMQPYTHNLTIKVGDTSGATPESKVTVSAGTITFADTTTASVSQVVLSGLTSAGDVRYIYFSIGALHKTTEAATIAWSDSYLNATSDLKGLLAIATKPVDFTTTTDVTSPYFNDGVAQSNSAAPLSVMTFKGHTDTLSVNLLAARAITSRHITTGQIVAKDFRTAAGVATGASGSPAGLWFNSDAVRGLSGGTASYTNISADPSQVEFEIRAANGKAYFAGGTIVLDCDGVNVWDEATYSDTAALRVRLDQDSGLKLRYGPASAIDFMENVAASNTIASINASGLGSTTYGGHSSANFMLTSDKLDVIINSASQDIGLFPDPTHGYVKIGKSKGLAFIDSTSAGTGMHNSNTDWVGLTGPSTVTNSTMYILPEAVSGDDEKFLKIASINTSSSPYIATLDWADATGGGGDGIKYFNAGGSDSGYTWTTNAGDEAAENAEDRMYFVGGNGITLSRNTATSPATPAIKWDLSATVSSVHTFSGNNTHSGNNTYSGTSTFTGGSFLVNSNTIRLGDATTDLLEVFSIGTYLAEQKYQGTILLQEEASSGSYGNATSGYGRLYVKQETPSHIYYKTSSGTETRLSSYNFKSIDIDNSDSGSYTWGTNEATAYYSDDVLYLIAGTGIELRSDYASRTGSTGAPAIRITATAVSGATLAFKTLSIGADIYSWSTSGSEVAIASDDTLFLIPSGSIIVERGDSSERAFRWSLASTVTTAHTWSGVQTFTGGSFLVNSGTIRLGDSTSDTMDVFAAGTYISEQKFDATILLDEEASTGSYGTPPSGYGRLYVKQESAAHIYFKNDSGTEFDLTTSGGADGVLDSASFSTSNGVLTLGRSIGADITVDLDGKYAEASHGSHSGDANQNAFSNVSYAADIGFGTWGSSGTAAADSATDTLYLVEGNDINIEVSSSGDGIKISSTASGTMSSWNMGANSNASTSITNGETVRFRDGAGIAITRQNTNDIYVNHANTSSLADTNHSGQVFIQNLEFDEFGHIDAYTTGTASGGSGQANQNAFGIVGGDVGQNLVYADQAIDTLSILGGTDIDVTTDASGDSLTINYTGSGGGGLTYWSESSSAFYPSSSTASRDIGTANNGIGWLYIDNAYGIKTNYNNNPTVIWETHGHHEFESDVYIKYGNKLTCESELVIQPGSYNAPSLRFSSSLTSGLYYSSGVALTVTGATKLKCMTSTTYTYQKIVPNGLGIDLGTSATSYRYATIYCVAVNESSDATLKENMIPLTKEKGLDFIASLTPIQYNMIDDSQIHTGFTAQHIKEKALAQGYTEDFGLYSENIEEDGTVSWGLVYRDLIAPLVASIKELKDRIEILEEN